MASLNHPNIAQIYGIEDRALVMELVPGLTKLESRMTDSSRLVRHTPEWFDFWERKTVRILNGEDPDRIPLEYTDALLARCDRGSEAR